MNTTVQTMRIRPGFWRLSANTLMIYPCQGKDAGDRCPGGFDAHQDGYCKEGYTGPLCQLCRERSDLYSKRLYHDDKSGECVECPEFMGKFALAVSLSCVILACSLAAFAAFRHPNTQHLRAVRSARRLHAWCADFSKTVGWPAKLKVRGQGFERNRASTRPLSNLVGLSAATPMGATTPTVLPPQSP